MSCCQGNMHPSFLDKLRVQEIYRGIDALYSFLQYQSTSRKSAVYNSVDVHRLTLAVTRPFSCIGHHIIDQNTRSIHTAGLRVCEAEAFGNDGSESLDERAQKALECPCIADLRKGLCGTQFSGAFLCFLKSTAEEKGSDCVHPFVALQSCIKAHPDAFSKDILEGDESKDQKVEQPTEEHKIIPPLWSVESSKSKSKSKL